MKLELATGLYFERNYRSYIKRSRSLKLAHSATVAVGMYLLAQLSQAAVLFVDNHSTGGSVSRIFNTINAAYDAANEGDEILVRYGTYKEGIRIEKNNVSLIGLPNKSGDLPVI